MPIPRIKICGIRTEREARLCLDHGADSLGFLLELTHHAADAVSTQQAHDIIAALPASANGVMVTHSLDRQKIVAVANETGVKTVQIHGDLPAADILALREQLPHATLLKSVHVPFASAAQAEKSAAIEKALRLADHVDALLLDSRTRDRLGGTGLTHDWQTSRQIVERVGKPVILAGGLNPANVAQAIAETGCHGVDVNSGVEDASGRKDPQKVKAYCIAAAEMLKL